MIFIYPSNICKSLYNDDSSVDIRDLVVLAKYINDNSVIVLKQAGSTDNSAIGSLRNKLLVIDSEAQILSSSVSVNTFANTVADIDGDLI